MANRTAEGRFARLWATPHRRFATISILVLIVLLVSAVVLAVQLLIVRSNLVSVMPKVSQLQQQIMGGDREGASRTADEVADAVNIAVGATRGPIWAGSEIVPFVGDDVAAVRLTAEAVGDLVRNGLVPLASLDLSAIGPHDGALDLAAIASFADPVSSAATAAERAQVRMAVLDKSGLLPPVSDALAQFTDALDEYAPTLGLASQALEVLPDALGASGSRDYIVLVQNNAEARSTGGNPGASMLLRAEGGRVSIVQQSGTLSFQNARPESIIPLQEPTRALHTDRVGRYIQDVTMPIWFDESGALARAFWGEAYGGEPHAVIGIDAVTLSYLLDATGPVPVPGGELRPEDAVGQLLNGIYYTYPNLSDHQAQDAYFAAVASNVFSKVTEGAVGLPALLKQVSRAAGEGRILYSPVDAREAKLVNGTSLAGPMPETSNTRTTALGVFVNDNTEGKLDYYTDMRLNATSDVCTTSGNPTFSTTATYNYTLRPDQLATLPYYISTGRYFPKGVKSTNLVFYGPVGARFVSATVDGQPYVPHAGVTDHSRPAVRILFENEPATSHTIEVIWEGVSGEEYGPIEVRHTPMVKSVPVEVSTPGC